MKSIVSVILLITFGLVSSQNNVSVNATTFKSNMEVVEAQVSQETISLVLHEIDKIDPKFETDNCSECPDGKSLILDVDFKGGFKFPIKETDSVYLRISNLQDGLREYQFNSNEIKDYEQSRDLPVESQLANNAELVKQKSMEISQLLQEGKISPEEAQTQLMALVEPQMNALDNSETMQNINSIDNYQERSVYMVKFYNDESSTEMETFSGYLYIKEFNKERFKAEYKGDLIEECVEKRAAKSIEEEQHCGSKNSEFLPGKKVLNEGSGSMTIDVKIKKFFDNRS